MQQLIGPESHQAAGRESEQSGEPGLETLQWEREWGQSLVLGGTKEEDNHSKVNWFDWAWKWWKRKSQSVFLGAMEEEKNSLILNKIDWAGGC